MKKRRKILSDISKNNDLTEFEKGVYRAALAIPRGKVRSYRWIANRIGSPRAYRAVGNALNRNPYATTVPCHRVIRSDGSPGGYAQGIGLKIKMLRSEGVDP